MYLDMLLFLLREVAYAGRQYHPLLGLSFVKIVQQSLGLQYKMQSLHSELVSLTKDVGLRVPLTLV